ncbi:MAG: DUF2070 family protein [Thermoproteales archaeon]|nr:DUF2070 family protein [Thermoproteales archaeon]
MRADLSGLTRSYKFIFSFPSLKTIMFETLIFSFLWFILILSFPNIFEYNILILCIVSFSLFSLTLFTFDNKIFTFRRSIALFPFFVIWGILYDFLNPFSVAVIIPPLLTLFTSSFFLSNKKHLKIIFFSYIIFISSTIISEIYIIIAIYLYILLLLIVYLRIDKRIYKSLKISGTQLFYSFIEYILSRNKGILEESLLSIGKKRELPIYKISFFNNNNLLGNIVLSYIHPGPFRDLGSSTLPYKIIQLSLKKNIPILYLKGACTHSENLIKSDILDNISNRVISKYDDTIIILENVLRKNVDDISALHFIFDKIFLSFISRLERGMEDIPYEVKKHISTSLSKEVLIVDSHNRLTGDKSFDTPSIGTILADRIQRTFNISLNISRYDVWVGFSHIKIKENQYEIGPGGIMFLTIRLNNKNYFIVSFDGNNMIDNTRDYLYEKMIQYGFIDGEITTTDTHIYSGLIPGVEYNAIGETLSKEYLYKIVKSLAENSIRNIKKVTSITLTKIPVSSYYMDKEKLTVLSELTRKNVRDGLFLIGILFLIYLITL